MEGVLYFKDLHIVKIHDINIIDKPSNGSKLYINNIIDTSNYNTKNNNILQKHSLKVEEQKEEKRTEEKPKMKKKIENITFSNEENNVPFSHKNKLLSKKCRRTNNDVEAAVENFNKGEEVKKI